MKGVTVETLPVVGGNAPTLLGADGTGSTNMYQNDHPVGGSRSRQLRQPSTHWDCTGGGNLRPITMNGPASSQFLVNYPGSSGMLQQPVGHVRNHGERRGLHHLPRSAQHDRVTPTRNGNFATSFFVRGNYVPQTGGNNAAQFCRNCHGGESNESHGVMNVPTT